MVRRGLVGIGAALVAGLLMGAVARLFMRLVAVATGQFEEFSLGGTVSIVVAFIVFALPGALLAAYWRGRGRSLLLLAGTAMLLVMATGIAADDVGTMIYTSAARWAALITAGLGVFAAILALPVLTLRLVAWGVDPARATRRPRTARRAPASPAA